MEEFYQELNSDELQKVSNAISDQSCDEFCNIISGTCDLKDKKTLIPQSSVGTTLIKQGNNNRNIIKETLRNPKMPLNIGKGTEGNREGIKSTYQQEKVVRNIEIRKNPVRRIKKRLEDTGTRPRLLRTKRRRNDEHYNQVIDRRQTTLNNIPYMNTRSVTKKMYNVGASYQAPTVKDEIEWKPWPVHGMHERPIYHPEVGLGVECNGNYFISVGGYTYQKISKNFKLSQAFRMTENQYFAESKTENSFENYMHESLHSVLAYTVQVTVPQYKCFFKNYEKKREKKLSEQNLKLMYLQSIDITPTTDFVKLQIAKPLLNLKCIKNHAKLQKVIESGSKHTLILLKTAEPLSKKKESSNTSTFDDSIINQTRKLFEFSTSEDTTQYRNDSTKVFTTNENTESWLYELISDTAILYCTAVGVHQDNFAMYLNTLDGNQCMNWINSRY